MSDDPSSRSTRILVVDDNAAIHSDFRKILGTTHIATGAKLDDLEKALFGNAAAPSARVAFRIDSAFQGKEALAMVQKALQDNDPYWLAFVDVRMPPGCVGVRARAASGPLHRLF